MFSREQHQKYQ